jgi:hypothetical protein
MRPKTSFAKLFMSCFIVYVTAGFSAALAGTFSKVEVRSFDFSSDGEIVVENVNGSITIESWNQKRVLLEVTKTVKADDQEKADEYFRNVRVEIESGSDHLEIHTHYVHECLGGFWNLVFHGGSKCPTVKYVLKVPAKVKVYARSTNGGVDIRSVTGSVEARSTNGGLNFDNVSGKIDGATTNGNISAIISDAANFQGLTLKTTNGTIEVYCPANLKADLSARTTNGDIETALPITVQGKFGHKSVAGKINDGGAPMYLYTTNGNIEINQK